MKKKVEEMSEREKIRTLDVLYTAATTVRGRTAVKAFLRDLLTESERIMLGRRIMVARLLLGNENPETIRQRTGVGYGTIGRIQKWLQVQFPEYGSPMHLLEQELATRDFRRKYATSTLFRLKKKYPLHFLLFPEPK